jgi:hypothetical protein
MAGLFTGRCNWLSATTSSTAAGSVRSSDRVVDGIDQLHVGAAEDAVRTRVTHVPRELLRRDVDDHRVPLRGKGSNALGPDGDGEPEEEDGLQGHHHDLVVGGGVALGARVVGDRVPGAPEACHGVEEEGHPADEQDDHHPVDPTHHLIELRTVRGSERGHAQQMSHRLRRLLSRERA